MIETTSNGDDIIVTGTDALARCSIELLKTERQLKHANEENALLRKQIDSLEDELAVALITIAEARGNTNVDTSNRFASATNKEPELIGD